jgi:hypothetical protein
VTERASEAVRAALERDHAETLSAVRAAAERVVDDWDGSTTTDREASVVALRDALDADGTLARLPDLLSTAVEAVDAELAAEPVAAPPYVVVTNTGPVLRGTLADRPARLVVRLQAFDVESGPGRATYRLAETPDGSEADGASVGLRVDFPRDPSA